MDAAALRKKYPKWAHRLAHHKKKKRRRKRSRRRRARRAASTDTVTDILLYQLMNQLLPLGRPLAKTHAGNVYTGLGPSAVQPDRLAPVRSRDERNRVLRGAGQNGGAGVGVAAVAGGN